MFSVLRDWYRQFFADPDAVVLFLFLIAIVLGFVFFGNMFKPIIVSIVIAYLLSNLIAKLEKIGCPHILAVISIYFGFIGAFIVGFVGILPPLWKQTATLLHELPALFTRGQSLLLHLPENYPGYISSNQIDYVMQHLQGILATLGQAVFSFSVATIPSLVAVVLYFVLVPFLVYFFLMDRSDITRWLSRFLPKNRALIETVWQDVHRQFGYYIRGRILEVILVAVVSYAAFAILGLQYAILLGVAVGISSIIPYIGAALVTIPVVLIGLLQWGWSADFGYLMLIYAVITIAAGYILEPLLFAETVNLHPVAIIVAILFFGAFWGFWGIFFAIPLASVLQAVIRAWPRATQVSAQAT